MEHISVDSQNDLEDWFNELDEKSLEIINQNLITEESPDEPKNNLANMTTDEWCEYVYVEDIMAIDLSSLEAVYIIQYECSISHFIKAMIENINRTLYNSASDSERNSDNIGFSSDSVQWKNNEYTYQLAKVVSPAVDKPTDYPDLLIHPPGLEEIHQQNIADINGAEQNGLRTNLNFGADGTPSNIPQEISNERFLNSKRFGKLTSLKYSYETPSAPSSNKLAIMERLKDIIIYLKWISGASEILAKRIGQEILPYTLPVGMGTGTAYPEEQTAGSTAPPIIRSSYNFCIKSTQCKNFYNKNEPPKCKNHHYVHSLVKHDIDSIIVFLNYIIRSQTNLSIDQLNNLYLSIKTICFITKNMQKEIYYIHYITKNSSEIYHRNNPIDLNKKVSWVKPKKHVRGGFIPSTQSTYQPAPTGLFNCSNSNPNSNLGSGPGGPKYNKKNPTWAGPRNSLHSTSNPHFVDGSSRRDREIPTARGGGITEDARRRETAPFQGVPTEPSDKTEVILEEIPPKKPSISTNSSNSSNSSTDSHRNMYDVLKYNNC
jgi:hypothetical protein